MTKKNYRYLKKVNFSKAVLWKAREISLNPAIIEKCQSFPVDEIWFEDEVKNERWRITLSDFSKHSELKRYGQENQYYIGIGLFKVETILDDKGVKAEILPLKQN